MTESIVFLRCATQQEALDVLIKTFDIADISPGESEASIKYNQERINTAREALKLNPNEEERAIYTAWLDFFQEKTDQARRPLTPQNKTTFPIIE